MEVLEIRLDDWSTAQPLAAPVRTAVFVVEQGVPREMEWDELDAVSCHALAFDGTGKVIGTGRLLPDGHVGRMAVLREYRGIGVGSAMLQALLAEAKRRGMAETVLHAQVHARPFYSRFGFHAEGSEFEEAGIAHVLMRRKA